MTQPRDITQLINGLVSTPERELDLMLEDPDTGAPLHPARATGSESLEQALAAADALHASGGWLDLPAADKAAAIRRLGTEVAARVDEIARADSFDSGIPLTVVEGMLASLLPVWEYAAGLVEGGLGFEEVPGVKGDTGHQWKLPWGPAAVIVPWNAPSMIGMTRVLWAITAGAPVILKPSEFAPHFATPFIEAVQAAGFPAGLVQVVQGGGDVGGPLVADPRIAAVNFTGGVKSGRAVAAACAEQFKRVELELSGNNPVVVLPDADPTVTAENIVSGMTFMNGQWCTAPRRVVVPAALQDVLFKALSERLDDVVLGPTTDAATQLGPLNSRQHLVHVQGQVSDLVANGASAHEASTLPDLDGHFMRPTILSDVPPSAGEEIFGPVVSLTPYEDIDEAIRIANDHPYGLSAYVMGADRDQAMAVGKRLRAGYVKVNDISLGLPALGTMAMWASSGLGEVGLDPVAFFHGGRIVG